MTLTEPLTLHSSSRVLIFYPNSNCLNLIYEKRNLLDDISTAISVDLQYEKNDRSYITMKDINEDSLLELRPLIGREEYDKLCSFFKAILLHILATKQPQVLSL